MSAATNSRPSSINNFTLLTGAFGQIEAECAAMYVTLFLASNGNNWGTEFPYESFAKWLNAYLKGNEPPKVNNVYLMMYVLDAGNGVILGLQMLINGGCIIRNDRDTAHDNRGGRSRLGWRAKSKRSPDTIATYFTVTSTFVEAMERFV